MIVPAIKTRATLDESEFITDPEGKILKRFIGSGENAFKLLDELLN